MYNEQQSVGRWVMVLVGVALLGGMIAAFIAFMVDPKMGNEKYGAAFLVACLLLLVGVIVMNLFRMNTEVDSREITVFFGILFPIYKKRIPLDQVKEARAIQYHPIRDFGGWGIKGGRIEGKRCSALNMSGDRGVLVVYANDKRLLIGSQQAEELVETIKRAAGLR